MVYAMVFGAHLFPYGWLYQSKTYYILSVIVPIGAFNFGSILYGCHYSDIYVDY